MILHWNKIYYLIQTIDSEQPLRVKQFLSMQISRDPVGIHKQKSKAAVESVSVEI